MKHLKKAFYLFLVAALLLTTATGLAEGARPSVCFSCHTTYENGQSFRFCPQCGAAMGVCPWCDTPIASDSGYRFCPNCGNNLMEGAAPAPAAPAPTPEAPTPAPKEPADTPKPAPSGPNPLESGTGALPEGIDLVYTGLVYRDQNNNMIFPGWSVDARYVPKDIRKEICCSLWSGVDGMHSVSLTAPDGRVADFDGGSTEFTTYSTITFSCFGADRLQDIVEGEYVLTVDGKEIQRFQISHTGSEEGAEYYAQRNDIFVKSAGAGYYKYQAMKLSEARNRLPEDEVGGKVYMVGVQIYNNTSGAASVDLTLIDEKSGNALIKDGSVQFSGRGTVTYFVDVSPDELGGKYTAFLDGVPAYAFEIAAP